MHPTRTTRRAATVALALLAATLLLAACGSSSPSSSTQTTTAKSASGASGGATQRGSRFAALRECLKKQGITLPQRVPGKNGTAKPPKGGAIPFGGGGQGFKLPSGVSRAKYEAAIKKCGGRGFGGGPGGRLQSPAFKKSLEKFAACLRENGVNLPKANTSGSGPIFDTKGINTNSATFRAAQKKCASLLTIARPGGGQGAAPGGQGAPEGGPPGGAPPGEAG